jgi:hypothetical protein
MQPKHGLHIPSGKFNLMSLIIIGLRMKALFLIVLRIVFFEDGSDEFNV